MADEGLTGLPARPRELPIRSGAFVAVVGPSGSGKDTLIAYARERLAGEADFVRRVITRPADAAFEDHDTLTEAAFDEALAAGAFAVTWAAHGLKYGLPASVDDVLERGRVAVANISRGAISAVRERYAVVVAVEVTAAPELLAARLAGRGRESGGALQARLARAAAPEGNGQEFRRVDNSGPVGVAGEALVAIIREAVGQSRPTLRLRQHRRNRSQSAMRGGRKFPIVPGSTGAGPGPAGESRRE